MRTFKTLATGVALSFLATQGAFAQEAPAKAWSGSIGAGLVYTSGNTETETGNAHFDLARSVGDWTHSLGATALYTADGDNTTAEKYFVALQTNRKLTDKSYLFGFTSYDNDRFSPFDYQATAAFGYGRHLIVSDAMNLKMEAGPGYRVSRPFNYIPDPVDATMNFIDPLTMRPVKNGSRKENEAVLRFAENFDWQFSENAKLIQELNVEAGSDNTVTRFLVAVETNVIGAIALRVSYALKNNSEVTDGLKKTDSETGISLAYSF